MQVVHVRVSDAGTGKPTPVRIRFTAPDGRYLAPLGRLSDFISGSADTPGNLILPPGERWAYIDGGCEIRLPAGPVQVEISKGFEYSPVKELVQRGPGQVSLRFQIGRTLDPGAEGWHAGDTHVLGLSPHAAVLEGAAEGLRIINLLARRESLENTHMKSGHRTLKNLLEFSGQSPALSREHCEVFVNTLNAAGDLGDLTLLNCHRIVFPLTLDEEGFEAYTLRDWCGQCHRKNGLVVWPRFPGTWGERLPNLLLGNIDAVEWTGGEPFAWEGLEEWYRLLNLGLRLPLVGGSGKGDNAAAVGAPRTYAGTPAGQELSYRDWIESIRQGRCFATRGPILRFSVNDQEPGAVLRTQAGARLAVRAEARSVAAFEKLQVVHNGQIVAEASPSNGIALLMFEHHVEKAGWLAVRCWGSAGLLAHNSPVHVLVADGPYDREVARPVFERLQALEDRVSGMSLHEDRARQLLETVEQAKAALHNRLAASPP